MKHRPNIVKHKWWYFGLSGLVTILGVVVFIVHGFNLGTDFKSGSQVELTVNQSVQKSTVIHVMQQAGVSVSSENITMGGKNGETVLIRLPKVLSGSQKAMVKSTAAETFRHSSFMMNTVSPYVAKQTAQKAVWAVLAASFFVVVYVAVRFEYRFAVTAVIALLHDAFIIMAVFALLHIEISLAFIAAVLTIVGYSVNDTIVIFDRIRENMRLSPPGNGDELGRLVNQSLWETMRRSVNTVTTVLLAALMLYLFGGESIHNFTFALIVGLVSGTYSSIFIASPLWLTWKKRSFHPVENRVN